MDLFSQSQKPSNSPKHSQPHQSSSDRNQVNNYPCNYPHQSIVSPDDEVSFSEGCFHSPPPFDSDLPYEPVGNGISNQTDVSVYNQNGDATKQSLPAFCVSCSCLVESSSHLIKVEENYSGLCSKHCNNYLSQLYGHRNHSIDDLFKHQESNNKCHTNKKLCQLLKPEGDVNQTSYDDTIYDKLAQSGRWLKSDHVKIIDRNCESVERYQKGHYELNQKTNPLSPAFRGDATVSRHDFSLSHSLKEDINQCHSMEGQTDVFQYQLASPSESFQRPKIPRSGTGGTDTPPRLDRGVHGPNYPRTSNELSQFCDIASYEKVPALCFSSTSDLPTQPCLPAQACLSTQACSATEACSPTQACPTFSASSSPPLILRRPASLSPLSSLSRTSSTPHGVTKNSARSFNDHGGAHSLPDRLLPSDNSQSSCRRSLDSKRIYPRNSSTAISSYNSSSTGLYRLSDSVNWHNSVIAALPGSVRAVRVGTWSGILSMAKDVFDGVVSAFILTASTITDSLHSVIYCITRRLPSVLKCSQRGILLHFRQFHKLIDCLHAKIEKVFERYFGHSGRHTNDEIELARVNSKKINSKAGMRLFPTKMRNEISIRRPNSLSVREAESVSRLTWLNTSLRNFIFRAWKWLCGSESQPRYLYQFTSDCEQPNLDVSRYCILPQLGSVEEIHDSDTAAKPWHHDVSDPQLFAVAKPENHVLESPVAFHPPTLLRESKGKIAQMKRSRKSTSLTSLDKISQYSLSFETNQHQAQQQVSDPFSKKNVNECPNRNILAASQQRVPSSSSSSILVQTTQNSPHDPVALINTLLCALAERLSAFQWSDVSRAAETMLPPSFRHLYHSAATSVADEVLMAFRKACPDGAENGFLSPRSDSGSGKDSRSRWASASSSSSCSEVQDHDSKQRQGGKSDVTLPNKKSGNYRRSSPNESEIGEIKHEMMRNRNDNFQREKIEAKLNSDFRSDGNHFIMRTRKPSFSGEHNDFYSPGRTTIGDLLPSQAGKISQALRRSTATVVRQQPVVDSDVSHPHDQTDFSPLLGLTIFHFVRSLGITEKKGSWEALLYLLTLLHNCKLDHLTVQQALLLALILQDRRKRYSRQRILNHPGSPKEPFRVRLLFWTILQVIAKFSLIAATIRYRRSVSRPSPFIAWRDVRSMEVVWSLFVSLWLSLVWLEDRRTPVLGWIEILQVLPEPTEYLQEAGFGVPHPLYSRMALSSDSAAFPPIPRRESSESDNIYDRCRRYHEEQKYEPRIPHSQKLAFLPRPPPSRPSLQPGYQMGHGSALATKNKQCCSKAPLLNSSGPSTSNSKSALHSVLVIPKRVENVHRPVSNEPRVFSEDTKIPSRSSSAVSHQHQEMISRTYVRRSRTITRRLRLPGANPRTPTVVTNVSHLSSSASSCVLTSLPCQGSSIDGPKLDSRNDATSTESSDSKKTQKTPAILATLAEKSDDIQQQRHVFQTDEEHENCSEDASRPSFSTCSYPNGQWGWHKNKSTKRTYGIAGTQRFHSPNHISTYSHRAVAQQASSSSHRYSGASYWIDQHHQRRLVNGGLQVGFQTATKSQSHQSTVYSAAQDAALEKRFRLKRLFVEECSRFYEDLEYRLDVSPCEVQRKWEDISRASTFPAEKIQSDNMRSVIGDTFGNMTPMLLYEEGSDDGHALFHSFFTTARDGKVHPKKKKRSNTGLTGIAWNTLKGSILRVLSQTAAVIKDSFDSCYSMLHTLITLSLLAFGLPAVITMSLALWIISELILPRLGIQWTVPIVGRLSRFTARVASNLLPNPTSSSPNAHVVSKARQDSNRNDNASTLFGPQLVKTSNTYAEDEGYNPYCYRSRPLQPKQQPTSQRTQNPVSFQLLPQEPYCLETRQSSTDSSSRLAGPRACFAGHPQFGFSNVLGEKDDALPFVSATVPLYPKLSFFQRICEINSITRHIGESLPVAGFSSSGTINVALEIGYLCRSAVAKSVKLAKRIVIFCLRGIYNLGYFLANATDLIGSLQLGRELLTGTWTPTTGALTCRRNDSEISTNSPRQKFVSNGKTQ